MVVAKLPMATHTHMLRHAHLDSEVFGICMSMSVDERPIGVLGNLPIVLHPF
jgi:hypothetical protein